MKSTARTRLHTVFIAAAMGVAIGNLAVAGHDVPPVAGTVRTIAEIPGGTGGLEVDRDGNLYSSEFGDTLSSGPPGTRVFKITPTGEWSVFAEDFTGASGNTFDSAGNFLQSNVAGNTVTIIAPDGQRRVMITEGLAAPVGITPGANNDFYVANCASHSLRRVTVDGTSEAFSTDPLLRCPNGLVLASDGNVYVSNFYNGNVVRVRPDGSAEVLVTLPGNNNGHIVFGNGVLYVAGRKAHKLYEVTLAGDVRELAGTGERGHADGPAASATLSLPNDLALSADGKTLYFNEVKPTDDPTGQTLAPTLVRALELGDSQSPE